MQKLNLNSCMSVESKDLIFRTLEIYTFESRIDNRVLATHVWCFGGGDPARNHKIIEYQYNHRHYWNHTYDTIIAIKPDSSTSATTAYDLLLWLLKVVSQFY